MRRILSLWLERWPTDRWHRRHGKDPDAPLVSVATIGNRRMVMATDRRAMLAGLAPGMTLADARARDLSAVAVEADPGGDAEALEHLARWCLRFSPWTAVAGIDGVWIDVTGSVPLFESEQALADELLRRLEAQGIGARAAIADTPGCAWAVARFAAPEGAALVVAPGGAKPALASLPVAALRLTPDIVTDLKRLGLCRIDMLYGLPRAPLAPRFGEIVARRLDQALGLADEPISPHRPAEPRFERLGFAEPILTADALGRALSELAERLCRRLERDGLGARRVEFACYRVDARVERVTVGTGQPSRDAAHLGRLLAARIEEIDPGFGIDLCILSALEVGARANGQMSLETGQHGGPAAHLTGSLADRLANRLGVSNVVRLAPFDSHVPERAMRRVPIFEPVRTGAWPELGKRPIRLLAPPDPIEAMAPVPDDPPVLFRWRRLVHRVRHAEGPERVAAEWWRTPDASGGGMRDYYRVEDEAGHRFWLYRDGLYSPNAPARWFLHGLFA